MPTIVQSAITTMYPSFPSTLAFPSSVTAGNLLIAFFGGPAITTITSVSDTLGNSWSLAKSASNGSDNIWIYWAVANSSGTTTVTPAGALSDCGVALVEVAGGSSVVDAVGIGSLTIPTANDFQFTSVFYHFSVAGPATTSGGEVLVASDYATPYSGGMALSWEAGLAAGSFASSLVLGSGSPGVYASVAFKGPALVAIVVTPTSYSVAAGATHAFTATAVYADSTTANITSSVTWASSNTLVATIASGGLATGVAAGNSNITATLGAVTSAYDALTVTTAALVSLAVTPASPSVAVSGAQAFVATGTFSDSSTANVTGSVVWASSNAGVATIASGGLATGVAPGTTNITASLGAITSPADVLTVVAPGGAGTYTELIGDGTRIFDASAGGVVFTLLPYAKTPNKPIRVQKLDASANTVTVQTDPTITPRDTFPGGVFVIVLTDNTLNYYTAIKKPGVSGVPAIVTGGVGSAGGTVSPTGGAPAQNVTSSTCIVNYAQVQGASVWYLTGTITLPTVSSSIAGITVAILGVDPSAVSLKAPTGGFGSTVTYQTPNYPMPLASEMLTVTFTVLSATGAATAGPYSLTVTIVPTTISSLLIAEVGPRTLQSTTIISITPTLANTNGSQYVTLWWSHDGGANIYGNSATPFQPGITTTLNITAIIPSITQAGGLTSNNFVVYAVIGSQPFNFTPMTYAALHSLYSNVVTSNAITVLPAASSSSAASATLTNSLNVAWTEANIYMGVNSNNAQYWILDVHLQTAGIGDPNTFAYTCWCQWVNSSGAPIAPGGISNPSGWRAFGNQAVANDGAMHVVELQGSYPAPGVDGYMQIQIWDGNLNSADGSGGGLLIPPFTGNVAQTLAACWPGAATTVTAHIGPPPAAAAFLPDGDFSAESLGIAGVGIGGTGSPWTYAGTASDIVVKNDGGGSTYGISNYVEFTGAGLSITSGVLAYPVASYGPVTVSMVVRSNAVTAPHDLSLKINCYSSFGLLASLVVLFVGPYIATWTGETTVITLPPTTSSISVTIFPDPSENPAGVWDVSNITLHPQNL